MKILPVNQYNMSSNRTFLNKELNQKNNGNSPVFKGTLGGSAGSAAGMLLGVAASFVVGPLAALAISGIGCVVGGIAGDKIEDSQND